MAAVLIVAFSVIMTLRNAKVVREVHPIINLRPPYNRQLSGNSLPTMVVGNLMCELINLYEERPCLYNTKCTDYHNRDHRRKSLEEIANKIGTTGI